MSSKQCLVAMTAIAFLLFLNATRIHAQEVPRLEIGAHVTALNLGDFKLKVPDLSKSERGAGARVTFNVSDNVSIEAEYNIFPNDFRITVPQLNQLVTRKLTRDRVDQFLMGVKVGGRSEHFGIFAKLRPGYISTRLQDETVNANPSLNTLFRTNAGLALDFGVVLEFYPTRSTMLRFDAGDMIIRYERSTVTGSQIQSSRFTTHNLQVSAGFGLRF
ncbi:MAG: outer membrane beta-barrel protein [Blastocatellia bacterium]